MWPRGQTLPRLARRRVPFQGFSGGHNPPLKPWGAKLPATAAIVAAWLSELITLCSDLKKTGRRPVSACRQTCRHAGRCWKRKGYFRKTNSSAYRGTVEFVLRKSKQCRGKLDVFRGIFYPFKISAIVFYFFHACGRPTFSTVWNRPSACFFVINYFFEIFYMLFI